MRMLKVKAMNDAISRCELFNKLATIPAPPEANEFKAEVYKVIQQMETVGRWIPCSERLPKEDGFYLVTITDGEQIAVCKMPFIESEWKGNLFDDEVIAWMLLPKPWKGADDEVR